MNKLKKIRYEILLFAINAIYMILELIASRLLTPYFGSSNLVWTSVIGIILLSSSMGNFIGGKLADKDNIKKNLKMIILSTGISILVIPLIQINVLSQVSTIITSLKIGAIISTILLFFIPSMLIGLISPIVVKLKVKNVENVGKISGMISAIATIGSLVGTFIGGFYLVPMIGSKQLLYILAVATILLSILVEKDEKKHITMNIMSITLCLICLGCFIYSIIQNESNIKSMVNNELNVSANFDTQYGNVKIVNVKSNDDIVRALTVGKGFESASYIDEEKRYELYSEYTKYYDLMFNANIDINNVMMIGGAGYSYPKYYLNKYEGKTIDVIEIDGQITELAKKYFFLQDAIDKSSNKINLICNDGRVHLNSNTKKYDAILNDAFTGSCPVATLTTIEAVTLIHDSLNENGVYLTNIVGSLDGENAKFLKAEVNTLNQVFKNVYVVPCNRDESEKNSPHNNMIVASDDEINIEGNITLNISENEFILTDNFCPVDLLIPII